MYKPELLSPAGSPESLTAAVRAGADAVYLGVGMFNARRNARNFTIDPTDDAACSLAEAVSTQREVNEKSPLRNHHLHAPQRS